MLLLSLFNGPEVLPSGSVKAKMFTEIFFESTHLDDLGISLPAFPQELI